MKIKVSTFALLILANCTLQNSFAGTEIKNVNEQAIVQALASNNVQITISILPAIEKLWPQQPENYFLSVEKAASTLGGATDDSKAKLALLNLFSNMIQKSIPTNGDFAVRCLEKKDSIILQYLNFDEMKNDKAKWVAVAKYIGEIRAQIIPSFVPKTVYLNPPGVMDSPPERVQQLILENQQNMAINNFQESLHTADSILTFQLLHNCSRFPASDPQNIDFIKDISSAAHLTEDEQHQLQ